MELVKRANRQSLLLALIMHLLFTINCIAGYTAGNTTLTPLIVSAALGLISFIASLFIYKANGNSKLVRYTTLAGIYLNHLFLMITTEISLIDFMVFAVLILMAFMFSDITLIKAVVALTAAKYTVFVVLRKAGDLTLPDILLCLIIFVGVILAAFGSLRVCEGMDRLWKAEDEKKAGGFKHVGNIANSIYENVTMLEGAEV